MNPITKSLILGLVLASGCSPYASKFNCPDTDPGKCVPVEQAYLESKGGRRPERAAEGEAALEAYRARLFSRMAGLLEEPAAPLVAPPKVMRVLFLPYRGAENELHMPRYTYFFVDEPRFVLGERARELED